MAAQTAYAAEGIGFYLHGPWRKFGWRCVGATGRCASRTAGGGRRPAQEVAVHPPSCPSF